MRHSPAHDAVAGTSFLDPAVLATIGNLELLARTVVDGFLHGLHRSARLGLSMEFAEHRPYMPGDEIRRIDWRVYARTDRFYVKEYEAETNATVTIVVDRSRSMDYGTGAVTKLDYGRFLAASLAWFSARQRDRIGLTLIDRDITEQVPPSTRHLQAILHTIDRMTPGGEGALAVPLRRIAEQAGRRGIFVLISDFYEDPDQVAEALAPLLATGGDVLGFQLLDPSEIRFPFEGAATFEDLERGEQLPVVPEDQRTRYQELMEAHLEGLSRQAARTGVDWTLCDISRPLDFVLYQYLVQRQDLIRTR